MEHKEKQSWEDRAWNRDKSFDEFMEANAPQTEELLWRLVHSAYCEAWEKAWELRDGEPPPEPKPKTIVIVSGRRGEPPPRRRRR